MIVDSGEDMATQDPWLETALGLGPNCNHLSSVTLHVKSLPVKEGYGSP